MRSRRDLAELTQTAGRADGWKDFNGMYNPAVAAVLRSGTLYLPEFREVVTQENSSKLLIPILIGRLLRRSKNLKVQSWFVTKSPHAQVDKLEFLFSSSNDPELIEAGSASQDYHIRCAVASNRNTPVTVLNGLVLDENREVRLSVINNPHTPLSDLEFLILDSDPEVSQKSRQKLSRIMGDSWVLAKFGPPEDSTETS